VKNAGENKLIHDAEARLEIADAEARLARLARLASWDG
jgi:hypothetical protein